MKDFFEGEPFTRCLCDGVHVSREARLSVEFPTATSVGRVPRGCAGARELCSTVLESLGATKLRLLGTAPAFVCATPPGRGSPAEGCRHLGVSWASAEAPLRSPPGATLSRTPILGKSWVRAPTLGPT